MKKILAFAGSNSSTSINQKLLDHVIDRVQAHEIKEIKHDPKDDLMGLPVEATGT